MTRIVFFSDRRFAGFGSALFCVGLVSDMGKFGISTSPSNRRAHREVVGLERGSWIFYLNQLPRWAQSGECLLRWPIKYYNCFLSPLINDCWPKTFISFHLSWKLFRRAWFSYSMLFLRLRPGPARRRRRSAKGYFMILTIESAFGDFGPSSFTSWHRLLWIRLLFFGRTGRAKS